MAGVGHDLSHLRPANTSVSNAAGTATGAVSFMPRYSNTTREVAQDGRRGALMLSIDINHPDIEQFIVSKSDKTKITGANISVKVDDEFMKAVENDEDYMLTFPCDIDTTNYKDSRPFTYGKVYPFQAQIGKGGYYVIIKAKPLWDKLIHQATTKAEPGILFWDKIKNESIPSCYGKEWEETSTNPCGEIPLCPYDSCRLLSVNLYSFVENPFTDKASFNYDKFKDVVYKAQRLMDDVVDLEEEKINNILKKIENDPELEEIKAIEKNLWIKIRKKLSEGRRTGLSVIGLADYAAALNLQYASDEMIKISEEIYKQFAIVAYKSSIDMAKERGAFPIWDIELEKNNPYLKRIFHSLPESGISDSAEWSEYQMKWIKHGRRNISICTIPPSGTISLLAGISSGIEPVYQLHYKRRRKIEKGNPKITLVDQNGDGWEEYTILHPKFKEWINYILNTDTIKEFEKFGINEKNVRSTLLNNLNEKTLKFLSEISPYHNSTSYEIDPIQRVKLQATIQKWIDHSISSTINLKKSTTEEEISNLYMEAWKQGCKGLTIYVDECRTGVLVSNKNNNEEFKQHNSPKRPKLLPCEIYCITVKGEDFIIFVGLYDNKPYEIFAAKNIWNLKGIYNGDIIKRKSGIYDVNIKDNTMIADITEEMTQEEEDKTRMISTALRHGADIKFITEQLNKTKSDISSFTKAICRILKKYIKDNEQSTNKCPECNANLIYKDGCESCTCGYSKCG